MIDYSLAICLLFCLLDILARSPGLLLLSTTDCYLMFLPWLLLEYYGSWSHLKVALFVSNHECHGGAVEESSLTHSLRYCDVT